MFDEKFTIEQDYLDDEENFKFEHVELEFDCDSIDDDLVDAFTTTIEKSVENVSTNPLDRSCAAVKPTSVDDFIRNFLIKTGMRQSLDVFNTEWYELQQNGKALSRDQSPDEYDSHFDSSHQLREEIVKNRDMVSQAANICKKVRRERDYHRLHHRQAVQEKETLMGIVKRLRTHMRAYEPVIIELQKRLKETVKQKSLIKLERDKLLIQVNALTAQVALQDSAVMESEKPVSPNRKVAMRSVRKQAEFPTAKPAENPYMHLDFPAAPFHSFEIGKPYVGHQRAVSCVAFHPTKNAFATGSDDNTWRLWSVANAQ